MPEFGLQLGRGEVPQGQQVHDPQPRRIREGRMLGDPRPKDSTGSVIIGSILTELISSVKLLA